MRHDAFNPAAKEAARRAEFAAAKARFDASGAPQIVQRLARQLPGSIRIEQIDSPGMQGLSPHSPGMMIHTAGEITPDSDGSFVVTRKSLYAYAPTYKNDEGINIDVFETTEKVAIGEDGEKKIVTVSGGLCWAEGPTPHKPLPYQFAVAAVRGFSLATQARETVGRAVERLEAALAA